MLIDSATDPLLDLRFADDILLVSQSRSDAAKMVRDLANEACKFGLKLHPGKTKLLTNAHVETGENVKIDGLELNVLSEGEHEKYLGKKLCMGSFHESEVRNRIAAGWASFNRFRDEFCGKHYCLRDKLRLFESTVTQRVLYGSASWTLTGSLEKELRVARRRMLRMILVQSVG